MPHHPTSLWCMEVGDPVIRSPASDLQETPGQIHADDIVAVLGEQPGDAPFPAAEIENPLAGDRTDQPEQRPRHKVGVGRRHPVVVPGGERVVARLLTADTSRTLGTRTCPKQRLDQSAQRLPSMFRPRGPESRSTAPSAPRSTAPGPPSGEGGPPNALTYRTWDMTPRCRSWGCWIGLPPAFGLVRRRGNRGVSSRGVLVVSPVRPTLTSSRSPSSPGSHGTRGASHVP